MKIHKKIKRLHKIKIHHNRWLIWACAAAVVAAIALVGYIEVSEISFQDQIFNFNDVGSQKTYHDQSLGFSINYPNSWGIEAAENNVVFSDPEKSGEDVSVFVYDADAEKALRQSLNISDTDDIKIDSVKGTRITNSITKKVKEQVILLPFGDKLYVIRGNGALFSRIATSFKFNQTTP